MRKHPLTHARHAPQRTLMPVPVAAATAAAPAGTSSWRSGPSSKKAQPSARTTASLKAWEPAGSRTSPTHSAPQGWQVRRGAVAASHPPSSRQLPTSASCSPKIRRQPGTDTTTRSRGGAPPGAPRAPGAVPGRRAKPR